MLDKALLSLLGEGKKHVVYAVACSVVSMLCNLLITAGLCLTVHALLSGAQIAVLWLGLSAVGIVGRYFASVATGNAKTKLGSAVKSELRGRAYDKILRLGVRATEDMSMAGLTQVTMEGIEQLELYYATYLPQFFYAMIAPLLLFIICLPIYWPAALVLLVCVPLIPVSIVAVSKYAKKIFAKYWGKYTSMGDGFLDAVQGLRELKLFRADETRNEKMNEQAEEFRRITMKVLVMQLFSTTIMDLVAYGGAGLGVCLALYGAMHGLAVSKALFLILVSVDFFLPLRALGSAFHVAMNGASAGRKLLDLLAVPDPIWGEKQPQAGDLELEHVSFSYEPSREILSGISMRFPCGTMTALVGESGAGKSTVAALLTGARRVKSGKVTLSGDTLESLDRGGYYGHLALVSYDTYLFHDTVRANFALAAPQATQEQIWAALDQVNLADFIRKEGGLDKVISEDAANLSGGQKQRLALAVALAADKDIYLLDEVTSNIDAESEKIIMDNVAALKGSKTVIVISHRLENVVPADNIYVLKDGRVLESGAHASLLAQDGLYAQLYRTQCALEEVKRHG